jgi:mitochondrial import inner membrane translocase subunit TIM22
MKRKADINFSGFTGESMSWRGRKLSQLSFLLAAPFEKPVTFPLVPNVISGRGELQHIGLQNTLLENCFIRGIGALVMGYGMGVAFGMVFAGFSSYTPPPEPFSGLPGQEVKSVPILKQLKEGIIDMRNRGHSTGKNFAMVGAVYSTVECFLEKIRGKRDMRGAVTSGFVTGAVLAARAGPEAMIVGGAGFATFSAIMEILIPIIYE